jgi:DNA-binding LacI/PurR family transcriptional regulator
MRAWTGSVVFVDRRLPGFQFVGGHDEAIGLRATTHLAEQGYRRIAHILDPGRFLRRLDKEEVISKRSGSSPSRRHRNS